MEMLQWEGEGSKRQETREEIGCGSQWPLGRVQGPRHGQLRDPMTTASDSIHLLDATARGTKKSSADLGDVDAGKRPR